MADNPFQGITPKSFFLQVSQPSMFRFCFDQCIKKDYEIHALNENCIKACNAKIINAYNFMLDVVDSGGIKRDSSVQRMLGQF